MLRPASYLENTRKRSTDMMFTLNERTCICVAAGDILGSTPLLRRNTTDFHACSLLNPTTFFVPLSTTTLRAKQLVRMERTTAFHPAERWLHVDEAKLSLLRSNIFFLL
jgi:hypothetical protein